MRKKRILVLLLSLLLFFESVGLSGLEYVSAAEPAMVQMSEDTSSKTSTDETIVKQSSGTTEINPVFGVNGDIGSIAPADVNEEGIASTGINQYTTLSGAASYVKKQMLYRESNIQFIYKLGSYPSVSKRTEYYQKIMEKVYAATSNPQGGDYLRYHVYIRPKTPGTSVYSSGSAYYVTYTLYFTYTSTYAQEVWMQTAIKNAVSNLSLSNCSDIEKIKKIHDYICRNVKYYDNDIVQGANSSHSAYAALKGKKSVCQGYATLFYAMCIQAGVSVRCIPGYGNGVNHLWNIVNLGSKWYNIDTTWDSQPTYPSGVIYNYFLKNNGDFLGHTVNWSVFLGWTSTQITAFNSKYPMTSASYTGSVGKPVLKSVASTGYNSLKVSWGKVNTAVGYYVYYAVSPSGTYTLAKKVKGGAVTSLNVTGLTPGRTYYFKVRAYSNLLTSAKSGYSAVLSGKAVPAQAVISSLTTKDKSITPVWKKIAGATGYRIAVTYKNGSTSTTKKLYVSAGTKTEQKLTIRGLRAGTNCQVKVQAYTTGSNGSKVYGSYSKVKKITVK